MSETEVYLKRQIDELKRELDRLKTNVPEVGGVWQDWTPTVSSAVGTITSYTANGRVATVGKIAHIRFGISITDKGTGSGVLVITNLPYTVAGIFVFSGRENVLTGKMLQGYVFPSQINVLTYDNNTPIATGAAIVVSGFYEIA